MFSRYVLIFLILCPAFSTSSATNLDFSYSDDSSNVGIPHALLVDNGKIWIGGENGLLEHRSSVQIELGGKENNWVTDLTEFDSASFLVTVFGKGLYQVDKKTNQVKELHLKGFKNKGVWKADVANNIYAVTTLNDLAIIEKSENQLLFSLDMMGPPPHEKIVDLSIDESGKKLWWVDYKLGLFNYDLSTSHWENVKIDVPADSTFHCVKVNGDNVYVGTNEGVLVFNTESKIESYITQRKSQVSFKEPVRTIFFDSQGKIWIAAESIYLLDRKEDLLIPNYFLHNPSLDDLLIVMDLAEDSEGNIYGVETNEGLVAFSNKTKVVAKRYRNLEDYSSMKQALITELDEIILLDSQWLVSSESFEPFNTNENGFSSAGFKIIQSSSGVNYIDSSLNIYKEKIKKGIVGEIELSEYKKEFFDRLKFGYRIKDELFFISDDKGKSTLQQYDKGQLNQVLPYHISALATTEWDTMLVAVDGRGLYEIGLDRKVQKLPVKTSNFYSVFTSLQAVGSQVLVGTSGQGLYSFDYSNFEITNHWDSLSFVRDIEVFGTFYVVASNQGLFAIHQPSSEIIFLGKEFGIHESDFSYDGISSSRNYITLKGDRNFYILSKNLFESELEKVAWSIHQITSSNIELMSEDLRNFYSESSGLEMKWGSTVSIKLPDFNYILRDLLRYGYSIDSGKKVEILNYRETKFEVPKLPPGNHTIDLRVLDPRSQAEQPITSVKIRVLPPWWQSWQAQLSFFVLMVIVTWLIYFIYQRRVREQAIFYTGLVDEKNYALTEAQDSLKEMLVRKQKQFTNLSHEIRTPLSLIIGPIAQLKKSIQSPENIEKVELVERNAKNIEAIIAEMMEIESFGNDAKRSVQEYAVNAVCSRILFDMVALAELARKKLMWKCDTTMTISLYKGTLEKIIGNLVSNAIKYTPTKGKIEVYIHEEELQLCIFVKDNGYGMSEEQMGKMYQRHIRFTEGGQGSGVGLALVKEVVMANDGWINVESAVDEGTTFRVFLPMLREIDQSANSPETKEITVQEPTEIDYDVLKTDHGSKSVILIVDDNEEMRLYLQSVLKDHYKCLLAEHGQQALEITAHIVPDLVITDYKMPVMSGTDLTLAMRESTLTSDIPIIMLSGLTDSDSVAEGLVASIDTYVNKPVNPEILLLRIKNLLNRNEKRREKAVAETLVQDNDHVPDYVTERDQKFYLSVLNQLELHYRNDSFTKLELANNLAISERQLHRKISAIFGTSYSDLLRDFRLSKAKEMLVEGKQITHVVYDAGFSAPSYFSRCFKENTGLTPTEYQKAHHKPKLRKVKHSPKIPKPE